ncbi:19201_t:CDS:2 [Funneliformis geosporum]|nr:19201_t:CDS:2 [Funneliformis geosporum]
MGFAVKKRRRNWCSIVDGMGRIPEKGSGALFLKGFENVVTLSSLIE